MRSDTPDVQQGTYFASAGVQVTRERFVAGSRSWSLGELAAADLGVERPKRLAPVALAALGAIPVLGGAYTGLVFVVAGLAWLALQKPRFHVALQTVQGEARVLRTARRDAVEPVVVALKAALAARG